MDNVDIVVQEDRLGVDMEMAGDPLQLVGPGDLAVENTLVGLQQQETDSIVFYKEAYWGR